MGKLENLIKEKCPNGVRYLPLAEIVRAVNIGINPRRFFKLNPDDASGFYVTVRELNGLKGVKQYEKTDTINDEAIAIIRTRANIEKGDILFSNTGTVGKLALVLEDPKNWGVNEGIYVIKPKFDMVLSKFLYYYLDSDIAYKDYSSKFTGSTLKHVTQAALLSIKVPVPPLEVQNEIVQILDNFAELTAELTAELSNRKKQYEYYRDLLLNFDENEQRERGVRWVSIEDICEISRGFVMSKDFIRDNAGEYPVYSSQTENNGMLGCINTYKYDGDYLTWTTDGANAGTVFRRSGKFSVTNVCGLLKVKDSTVSNDYLYYILSNTAKNYVNSGMGNPKLMSNVMARIMVPIPDDKEQQRIVDVLDRFDKLTSDISEGLPAEIEAREKQYAYYRDKLLTFEEAK